MKRTTRNGFTLVELLVVIAIIAILVSLTTAAVQKVRERGRDVQCRSDITQLGSAITNFKATFGVYPPCFGSGTNGAFLLQTDYSVLSTNSPEAVVLTQMFPRIQLSDTGLRNDISVTYASSNKTSAGVTGVMLDPNQSLMFFLTGGRLLDYQGFSTDPKLPFKNPKSGASRLKGGSFFEQFANASVRKSPKTYSDSTGASTARFSGDPQAGLTEDKQEPWFCDPWGTPYLYLCTLQGNDYPFDTAYTHPDSATQTRGQAAFSMNPWNIDRRDNPVPPAPSAISYNTSIRPFRESGTRFVESKGFQIISGGRNLNFGSGGNRAKGGGAEPGVGSYALNRNGGDDYANFQQTPLGVAD